LVFFNKAATAHVSALFFLSIYSFHVVHHGVVSHIQKLSERILRKVVFNWMPKSIQMKQLTRDSAYRPQANFIPEAPKRGTTDIIRQWPSKRIQKEKEEAEKKAAVAGTAAAV
jgi:hypothetical protein